MGKALSKKLGPLSDFEAIVKDYEGREFPPMYVLTNESNFFGSGVLAYDGVLKEVSDKIFSKELIRNCQDVALDRKAICKHLYGLRRRRFTRKYSWEELPNNVIIRVFKHFLYILCAEHLYAQNIIHI